MSITVVNGGNIKSKKKKANNRVLFWSAECKYSVIIDRVNELDWKLVDDEKQENKVNLLWIDVATIHEHFRNIQPWQSINHFPGMPNIARKNRMGQNLNKMLKLFPKEYSFYPRTWILPGELADFRTQFDNSGNSIGNKIYIIKPDAGCQGRGIFLTRSWDSVPMQENVVAQLYIKKPLLIDGYKFDLRLYCLVSSVKPLRMYLFHDGLVRMCTEEYVKPTKQNISNACMHLTNYAVNKHNENFQQPSAKSSEESQDEGSKRSLMWFMSTVRKDKGDAKADWLWRRMGTLCTRTVMSIIPVLSREYDQHFKSFNNVPVDISKLLSATSYSAATSGSSPNTVPRGPVGGKVSSSQPGNGRGDRSSRNNNTNGNSITTNNSEASHSSAVKSGGGEASEEEEGEEEEDRNSTTPADSNNSGNETKKVETINGEATAGIAIDPNNVITSNCATGTDDADKTGPKIRGSRCFEILGFDIMLDSNYKPWLIEVNHLPSFGTDSPLDKDIKERLMEQVFSVLPVMSDDQQAYLAHHKAESEKRLVAQRNVLKQQEIEKAKPPPPVRKREAVLPPVKDTFGESNAPAEPVSLFAVVSPAESAPEPTAESLESKTGENNEEEEEESEDNVDDEECTPERLNEIKNILLDVYRKFSPEKSSKIDRLLQKYIGHEEEFLRFVFTKYSVDPKIYKRTKRQSAETSKEERAIVSPSIDVPTNQQSSEVLPKERAHSMVPKARLPNPVREPSKRYSRSLSPPRAQKRSVAAWKGGAEEDAAFRVEVLAQHVPDPDEEWMQWELSRLTQFTRIFPPEHFGRGDKGAAEEEDRDDEDENDNEDGDEEKKERNAAAATAALLSVESCEKSKQQQVVATKATVTPIEEIMFQIFVQDKRQTMRLRCPLPNRAKADSDSASVGFLPPLEQPQSSRSSSLTSAMSGKGTVGWKAPPKPAVKEPLRQPTETQSAAAKRLSQGLSVNNNHSTSRSRNPMPSNAYGNVSSSSFSVVLDTHDYSTPGPYDSSGYQQQQQMGQLQLLPDPTPWLSNGSTKASRLLEERNMNRIRMEQAKASSAAVLRQQVFHFDPNYDPFLGGGGGGGGAIANQQLQQQSQPTGMSGGNYSGNMNDNASVIGGGSVIGSGSVVGAGHLPLFSTAGNNNPSSYVQQPQRGGRGSFSTGMSIHEQIQQSGQNGNNNSNHTQEELLKQLFPSWF